MKYKIHSRNTSKTQQFALIEKNLFGPNEEERKQDRKANRIITLDGGNDKKVKL